MTDVELAKYWVDEESPYIHDDKVRELLVEARIDEAVYILENGKWINESKGLYCFACNTVSHMNQYKNKVATLCVECGKDLAYYPMIAAQMFIKRRIAQLQDNQGASNE